jgi:mRNA interferase HigB
MHIITQKRIWVAAAQYQDCASALDAWYRAMKIGEFTTFAELRKTFASVDRVGKLHVFNVGGNKLRIICALHFNTGKVFIRAVLNHTEYDRDAWKE